LLLLGTREILKSMYKTFFSLDWRILAAFCFIASILIAIFIFFSINPGSPTVKSTPSVSPVNRQNITPTWQVYSETGYSISYPPDVIIEPAIISGGGNALVFHLPQGVDYSMQLEVLPVTSTNKVEISLEIFRILSYPEIDINISGKSGKEFSGSNVIGEFTVQEKVAILENQGEIYKLYLLYYANKRNTEVDNIFSQILSSLNFN